MPDWSSLGRWILLAGVALVLLGGLMWLLGRAGLPVGRLPGDLRFQSGSVTCFVPIATSLLLSLLLTVVLNLLARALK